jgi:hypothetical protein
MGLKPVAEKCDWKVFYAGFINWRLDPGLQFSGSYALWRKQTKRAAG